LSVPDEDYSRNVSLRLNLTSTLFLKKIQVKGDNWGTVEDTNQSPDVLFAHSCKKKTKTLK
jgi:hypothetical protein